MPKCVPPMSKQQLHSRFSTASKLPWGPVRLVGCADVRTMLEKGPSAVITAIDACHVECCSASTVYGIDWDACLKQLLYNFYITKAAGTVER